MGDEVPRNGTNPVGGFAARVEQNTDKQSDNDDEGYTPATDADATSAKAETASRLGWA